MSECIGEGCTHSSHGSEVLHATSRATPPPREADSSYRNGDTVELGKLRVPGEVVFIGVDSRQDGQKVRDQFMKVITQLEISKGQRCAVRKGRLEAMFECAGYGYHENRSVVILKLLKGAKPKRGRAKA